MESYPVVYLYTVNGHREPLEYSRSAKTECSIYPQIVVVRNGVLNFKRSCGISRSCIHYTENTKKYTGLSFDIRVCERDLESRVKRISRKTLGG